MPPTKDLSEERVLLDLSLQIKEMRGTLSMAALARRLDVSIGTIHKLERWPRVSLRMLFRVARFFEKKLVIRFEDLP